MSSGEDKLPHAERMASWRLEQETILKAYGLDTHFPAIIKITSRYIMSKVYIPLAAPKTPHPRAKSHVAFILDPEYQDLPDFITTKVIIYAEAREGLGRIARFELPAENITAEQESQVKEQYLKAKKKLDNWEYEHTRKRFAQRYHQNLNERSFEHLANLVRNGQSLKLFERARDSGPSEYHIVNHKESAVLVIWQSNQIKTVLPNRSIKQYVQKAPPEVQMRVVWNPKGNRVRIR